MATALLNSYLQENCGMAACVSKSPSKWWGTGRGCVSACVHMFLEGGRRKARRKEKLARENKVNEAWRRLPSSVFGRSSRATSFTVTTSPGARTEKNSLKGAWWLVEEQSGCKRILCVYLVCLWLLTETTLDSTGLQSSSHVFEQTLTSRIHLHLPNSNWISLH